MSDYDFGNLPDLPGEIADIDRLLDDLDHCLLVGFSHLTDTETAIFESLQSALDGTPLSTLISGIIDSYNQNILDESFFEKLSIIRSSLQTVKYEALKDHLTKCLGRKRRATDFAPSPSPGNEHAILDAVRSFLKDLAIAGFERINRDILEPFDTTLDKMLDQAELYPIAALLTGFYNELINALPINSRESVPLIRWCDLWSRVFLKLIHPRIPAEASLVDGEFFPLGSEYLHHRNLVAIRFHGLLETAKEKQLVQITFSSLKVDIVNLQSSQHLIPQLSVFLQALSGSSRILLRNYNLYPTGDLEQTPASACSAGKSFDRIGMLSQYFCIGSSDESITINQPHPFHCHPAVLAEPVLIGSPVWTMEKEEYLIEIKGTSIPIRFKHVMPEFGTAIKSTGGLVSIESIFGILKFDSAHWFIQPLLVVSSLSNSYFAGSSMLGSQNPPKDANQIAILKERASRLLRGKGGC
ncbi:MAG: hypothetical protein JW779_10350 [Candidatus Thorarchaeota archaeon]|nr:hypothetical protein [Candidatus Thorarchaeota archaeon]